MRTVFRYFFLKLYLGSKIILTAFNSIWIYPHLVKCSSKNFRLGCFMKAASEKGWEIYWRWRYFTVCVAWDSSQTPWCYTERSLNYKFGKQWILYPILRFRMYIRVLQFYCGESQLTLTSPKFIWAQSYHAPPTPFFFFAQT